MASSQVRTQQVENGGHHVVEDSTGKAMARTMVSATVRGTATTMRARSVPGTWLGMDRSKVMDTVVPSMLSQPVPSILARERMRPPIEDIGWNSKDQNGQNG